MRDVEAAADSIMSARHSDAFTKEACVKIIHTALERLERSRDFYKRRCDALQRVQGKMRDPERKWICDILANGQTFVESEAAQPKPESWPRKAAEPPRGWQEIAIKDVLRERKNQQQKWGEQNHEMPIWLAILHEETGELSEAVLHSIFGGPERNEVFKEAVHVAAVGLQIVEFLRRDKPNKSSTIELSHAAQPQPSKASPLGERSDAFTCRKCGRALGWCEPNVCDKCIDQPSGSGQTADDKQKEWTPDYVDKLLGFVSIIGCKRIAEAHNAALKEYKEKAWKYDQLCK
jgi:NTP pyrophosphatase (non-canonical NTP hydrolase)